MKKLLGCIYSECKSLAKNKFISDNYVVFLNFIVNSNAYKF